MPQFISKDGVWHPATERVALRNLSGKVREVDGEKVQPGDEYIYKGPDRAALFELFQQKVENFGQDFRTNPEFLQAIRNQGFTSVDEYLKLIGYNAEKVEADFKKKASIVHKDELPKRVKSIEVLGGGQDTAGDAKTRYGGFGEPPKD